VGPLLFFLTGGLQTEKLSLAFSYLTRVGLGIQRGIPCFISSQQGGLVHTGGISAITNSPLLGKGINRKDIISMKKN
jgi:hypothetical protein